MIGNKTRLSNNFYFNDQIPKDFTSGVVYKFQCGFCNESFYGKCLRHFNVRIGEHIGISPLIRKQVKPKNSPAADHLLLCNDSASYDDFSILTRENKKIFPRIPSSEWFQGRLSLHSFDEMSTRYSWGPKGKKLTVSS